MPNHNKFQTLRDRIVAGTIIGIATLLFAWLFVFLLINAVKNEVDFNKELVIVLFVCCWLIYVFGTTTIKIIFFSDSKYFVNLIALIVFNAILTAGLIYIFYFFIVDFRKAMDIADARSFSAIGFLIPMAFVGWLHIYKRLQSN